MMRNISFYTKLCYNKLLFTVQPSDYANEFTVAENCDKMSLVFESTNNCNKDWVFLYNYEKEGNEF